MPRSMGVHPPTAGKCASKSALVALRRLMKPHRVRHARARRPSSDRLKAPPAAMSAPAKAVSVRQFFARHGLLSRCHPQFEFRPGQMEMAEAVEAAIRDKRHLLVDAGTGTGKTLAYLVPAILAGRRVVISTGTKNLQEQLFFRDVPFLQEHFPAPLNVCYMKGRNNYACRQKI